jgi:flagellar assembly protein FliH
MTNPKIIKSTEGARSRQAKSFVFEDLEGEAKAIILDARRRAEEVIKEALSILRAAKEMTIAAENKRSELAGREREIGKLARQAEDKGYKEGFDKGREEGFPAGVQEGRQSAVEIVKKEISEQVRVEAGARIKEKTARLADTIAQIAEKIADEAERLKTTAREDLIKLAIALAERIVKKEIAIDPAVVKSNVQKAVELSIQKSDIEVVVNPADRELIEDFAGHITETFARVKRVKVVADDSVSMGSCLVRSGGGVVDMQIETQLEEIKRRLIGSEFEGESELRL